MRTSALTLIAAAGLLGCVRALQAVQVTDCTILIAGGSLASIAAAIGAANATKNATVCLLEITDELGGQLTTGGVPAVDFGLTYRNFPANLSPAFGQMLSTGAIGDNGVNPGGCTVSTKCFLPELALAWLNRTAASLAPTLRIYYGAVAIASERDAVTGVVTSVTAVQRTPTAGTTGWDRLLSEALTDWYSPFDSAWFIKTQLTFTGFRVVIDASEFGDVLMTSGVRVAQGIEVPTENSTTYDDACGQASAVGFYLSWGLSPAPSPDPAPPGSAGNFPFHMSAKGYNSTLTWRRSFAVTPNNTADPMPGDTMLLQSEQDVLDGLLLLPLAAATAQVRNASWSGGVNLTTLARMEARAYGWYHALVNYSRAYLPQATAFLSLNYTAARSATGVAKLPYLREARRSRFGVQGFRLCHNAFATNDTGPGCWRPPNATGSADADADAGGVPGSGANGYKWVDTIAIGEYGFDVHRLNASFCTLPDYLMYSPDPLPSRPYYLPLRALTSWDAPNLLVAGKNMAQTFFANAATRLHPEEWSTGMAAGVTAVLMVQRGWTSNDAYMNHSDVQAALMAAGQPLEWV